MKLSFALVEDQTAEAALLEILRSLAHQIRAHEAEAAAGRDPEGLHDFRVAIRRTRSALGQIKGVLRRRKTARFRRDLRWLGAITGPARDLDVQLQLLPELVSHADDDASLTQVIGILVAEREKVIEDLRGELRSKRYRGFQRSWKEFLAVDYQAARGRRCGEPILELSNRRIVAAHRKVVERADRLTGTTSRAELFHRLRIDCKKLRYLMEFFRSLHPPESISPLIKDLKRLQDYLGEMNDLSVGGELLSAVRLRNRHSPDLVTALDRVSELVDCRFRQLRDQFGSQLKPFTDPVEGRGDEFRELFGG